MLIFIPFLAVANGLSLLPNIEAITYGYDIVKGNPFSLNTDPGFTSPLFNLSYVQNNSVGSYAVPDFMSGLTLEACSSSGSYIQSSNGNDFQNGFTEGGSITFDPSSLGFNLSKLLPSLSTGSPMYTTMFEKSGFSSFVYTAFTAECDAYEVAVSPGSIRPLSTAFVNGVSKINPQNPQTLYTFTNEFGTHFFSYLLFGGNSFFYSTIETSTYYELTSKGVKVDKATQLQAAKALNVDIEDDPNYKDYLNLTSSQTSWSMHGIPFPVLPCANPPCQPGDASAWRTSIQLPSGQAQPIKMKLSGIFELLTSDYFPNDPLIDNKRLALIGFLNNDYCGMLPNCGYTDPNEGLIAWFDGVECPPEWSLFKPAVGRVLLSVMNGSSANIQVNSPLDNLGSPPPHEHTFSGTFNLYVENMFMDAGPGNSVANSGPATFTSITGPSVSMPEPFQPMPFDFTYTQMLLCRYTPSGNSLFGMNLPLGAVTYFDASVVSVCPSNWINYEPADGRVIVPSSNSGVYPSLTPPVVAGQSFNHTHAYDLDWSPSCSKFCSTNTLGEPRGSCDSLSTNGIVDSANNNIPYLSVLTCYVTSSSVDGSGIPPGLLIYTPSYTCPPGWIPINDNLSGHFLVAVSENGDIQSVGNTPIPPGSTSSNISHAHVASAIFSPTDTDMTVSSGCYNSWSLPQPNPTSLSNTTGTDGGVPYIQLMMCKMNTTN
jgi:hypothetical protein